MRSLHLINKIIAALGFAALLLCASQAQAKPLKVYILAGQSNMEGHANARTFDYIGQAFANAIIEMQ